MRGLILDYITTDLTQWVLNLSIMRNVSNRLAYVLLNRISIYQRDLIMNIWRIHNWIWRAILNLLRIWIYILHWPELLILARSLIQIQIIWLIMIDSIYICLIIVWNLIIIMILRIITDGIWARYIIIKLRRIKSILII